MKKIDLSSIKSKNKAVSAAVFCVLAIAVVVYLACVFKTMQTPDVIYAGPGVTRQTMLSEWLPALEGTAGDTAVYILEGKEPGDTMLVMGGTHANEPSGVLSAVYLIENCEPAQGTLIVIPETNATGFTCTDPQEAAPMFYEIETPTGVRTFRYGSRATNPIYQWPDPDIYQRKAADGQKLSGAETRNLNRTYPGVATGTITEKISAAITALVNTENVKITVDLHEASPEYPTIHAIVAHEDAMSMASLALLNMQLDGVDISLEPSAPNLHGLTHRELGDYTDTFAVLMETANPAQGRLHGKTSSDLVVYGQDKYYEKAGEYGALYVNFTENGFPIAGRVARHVTGIVEFANAYTEGMFGSGINLGDLASYDELCNKLPDYLCIPTE